MHQTKTSLNHPCLALFAGLALLSSTVPAASQCQGMPHDACAATDECAWVQGYVRKDGRSVSSHCKSRGGKKAGNPAPQQGAALDRSK